MENGEGIEGDIPEALDARVFNPPIVPEKKTPAFKPIPFPEEPFPIPDFPEKWLPPTHQELPPPAPSHKNPKTGAIPKTPQPQVNDHPTLPTPVVPHLPSRYAPTYELEKFNVNRMIIFNHDKFLKGNPRPGTLKDEESLRATFGKFRFEIDTTYMNYRKKALIDTVKKCKYILLVKVFLYVYRTWMERVMFGASLWYHMRNDDIRVRTNVNDIA